ncbi:hypothetical protein PAECIP111894_06054 [Paenibacillus pseudetheri]|uniref:Uncharacterized protein n=1 Tax=Paenibacillus pseudetheri TaxID=2897682 RepID=A0ABM9BL73_9BACL|nr:hypothetical protein PAECIP111894_06054 [Paenibacillus pseudetheri]
MKSSLKWHYVCTIINTDLNHTLTLEIVEEWYFVEKLEKKSKNKRLNIKVLSFYDTEMYCIVKMIRG